uniref:TIL domain-containing protein n=1 Tax=Anopheles atroparvus TaxID=41427 RepID=A0A182JFL5_ANOAO
MAIKLTVLAVVLTVLVLYVHAQDADPQTEDTEVRCRRREEYLECGNRCTESKCKPNKDQICLTVCEPGCYCRKGTSRNDYGNCVPNYMCAYINYIG